MTISIPSYSKTRQRPSTHWNKFFLWQPSDLVGPVGLSFWLFSLTLCTFSYDYHKRSITANARQGKIQVNIMTPKVQATGLSIEQVQLLCQVVQYSESPKKETWDVIAKNLNITNGNAA